MGDCEVGLHWFGVADLGDTEVAEDVTKLRHGQVDAAFGLGGDGQDHRFGNGHLAVVDAAREEVVKTRAELGTAENQLESQVRSLRASEAALAESESRISDTDFANEVAAQTKNSILQEFALAVQGQANASKEAVLKLLGVD